MATEMKDLIKQLRAEHGLSQRRFAEAVGVSESMVARVEIGDRWFGHEVLTAIHTALDLDDEWLDQLMASRRDMRKVGRPADDWRADMERRLQRVEEALGLDMPSAPVVPLMAAADKTRKSTKGATRRRPGPTGEERPET